MALPPKFAGHKLPLPPSPSPSSSSSTTTTPHTLELYLDYVCPFSAKLFNTVYASVAPLLAAEPYAGRVQVIFRQQVQPWHPSSTLVHEAGVAVLRVRGERFWEFSKALFDEAKSFYDVNVVNETRNQTYKRLAAIASKSTGVDEQEFLKLLQVDDKPAADGSLNIGNGVTNDLKVLVKMNRMQGVHVTPTVVFNGVVENGISSGMSGEEWAEWLKKNIV